jgi:NADH-quinone oxidoreductase subunit F
MEKFISKYWNVTNSHTLDFYQAHGGYAAAKKALSGAPEKILEQVKDSKLRGRGGAGFPTASKWSFVPKNTGKPIYLVCNADESEPGTFKDRQIMEWDPHQMIEGMIIAAYCLGVHTAYIYIRGEYHHGYLRLREALQECYKKNILGKKALGIDFALDIFVHRGAGAYICGEETALLNSLEGKRGEPRNKPPFPAIAGLYGCPTVVNNVETFCAVTQIFQNGAEWFKSIGTENGTGPKLYCVSGHVNKPGVYELPMNITLRELIEQHAGGIRGGKKVKAVFPGGSSSPILTASEIDVTMDFDSLAKAGSMLGSAAVMVMDEDTSMVDVACNLIGFYHHESCGQCTPCREGTEWMEHILKGFKQGRAVPNDIATLERLFPMIEGKTICPFGEAFVWPIRSLIRKFKAEFEQYIVYKGVPVGVKV